MGGLCLQAGAIAGISIAIFIIVLLVILNVFAQRPGTGAAAYTNCGTLIGAVIGSIVAAIIVGVSLATGC